VGIKSHLDFLSDCFRITITAIALWLSHSQEPHPFWILDFRFWIIKVLPVGSFGNSNVAKRKQNASRNRGLVVQAEI
jgi:hypothetical protein